MFVIRFDYEKGEPLWAGRFGKGTTAGGWGWTAYESAETFATVDDAQAVLDCHYDGQRGAGATIVDQFDGRPPAASPTPDLEGS